jgi:hypothetical protein
VRPIILGMNDPSGTGCLRQDVGAAAAGHRLWRLSGLSREAYLEAFERVNLLDQREWCPVAAREAAQGFLLRTRGRRVIVLGKAAWVALGLPRDNPWLTTWHDSLGGSLTLIPHPSGKNLILNDKAMRQRVKRCLTRSSRSPTP